MESPNAPIAQDFFTPAWLKLPDPQLSKKSSSSAAVSPSSTSGVDSQQKRPTNNYNSFHRKELNNSTNSLSANESRDRLANTFHDSSQTYLRHNSFGSEQQFNSSNSIGNNVNGFRAKKYSDSSQRPPFRANNYRDKTPANAYHSNTKANRNIDPFKPNFDSPTKRSFGNNSFDYSLDNESPVKSTSNEQNCNNVFNQEFPSLVNDINGGQKSGPNDNSGFHSAWSNNATKSKVLSTSKNFQLIHSSVANFDNIQSSNKSDASITSNTSKPVITSGVYRNVSLIGKAKTGILKENAIYSRIQPMITKSTTQATTPAMEILVKNPKKRSNKSDFLNSIRSDQFRDKESDKDNNHFEEKLEKLEISTDMSSHYEESESQRSSDQNNQIFNENDAKKTQNMNNKYICVKADQYEDEDMGVLSSSLEAEHRLLLELGWKAGQDDDPSYAPLTEDEVKEFKDLINTRNGFNGMKRNAVPNQTIQLTLSPKKWPQNGHINEEPDDESTSSSDDD